MSAADKSHTSRVVYLASPEPAAMTICAVAASQAEIAAICAARRYELGIPGRAVDEIAGYADGYTSKIEAGMKLLGPMSLQALCGALGLLWMRVEGGLLIVSDDDALPARTRRLMGSRCRPSHSVTEKRMGKAPAAMLRGH